MTVLAAADPRVLQQHASDSVALVLNAGGLPAGSVLDGGLTLRDTVPQAHKLALLDIAARA